MSEQPTATALQPGDRVRRRDGGMTGVVRRVIPGNPLARSHMFRVDRVYVDWDNGYLSRLAVARVEKIGGRP